MLRRHKYILLALSFYWPAIFIATHVKVPKAVGQIGMSDKVMHFLMYLVLVCLAWFAMSPHKKVDWRKAKVWLVLAAVVWYGAMDEWLQSFVGRSMDVHDFYADLAGAISGLLIVTVFSFWPALLVAASMVIFAMTNLTVYQMILNNEFINAGFYFLAYVFFTLVWIQILGKYLSPKTQKFKWFVAAIGVPVLFLAAVKVSSLLMGKSIWYMDCVTAVTGIVDAAMVSYFTIRLERKKRYAAVDGEL